MIKPAPQPDSLLGWMEGLSDPRNCLLRLLERHELGVVELCDILQLPQSTVSRHLKVLLDYVVLARRQGTTHLYNMVMAELDPPARRLWLLTPTKPTWAAWQQDQLRWTAAA